MSKLRPFKLWQGILLLIGVWPFMAAGFAAGFICSAVAIGFEAGSEVMEEIVARFAENHRSRRGQA